MPANLQTTMTKLGQDLDAFYSSEKYQRRAERFGLRSSADVKTYLNSPEGKETLATIALMARLQAEREEQMTESMRLEEQGGLLLAARGLIDSRDDYFEQWSEHDAQQSATRRTKASEQKEQVAEYKERFEEYEKEIEALTKQIDAVKKEIGLVDERLVSSEQNLQQVQERHTIVLTGVTEISDEITNISEDKPTEAEKRLQQLELRVQEQMKEVGQALDRTQDPAERIQLGHRMTALQTQQRILTEVASVVRKENHYYNPHNPSSPGNYQTAMYLLPTGKENHFVMREGNMHYFDRPDQVDRNDPASWRLAQERFNTLAPQLRPVVANINQQFAREVADGVRVRGELTQERGELKHSLNHLEENRRDLIERQRKLAVAADALNRGMNSNTNAQQRMSSHDTSPKPPGGPHEGTDAAPSTAPTPFSTKPHG